jgi:hypothetical protein
MVPLWIEGNNGEFLAAFLSFFVCTVLYSSYKRGYLISCDASCHFKRLLILSSFVRSRKASITFVTSSCQSHISPVRMHQHGSRFTVFREILHLGLLYKFIGKNIGHFARRPKYVALLPVIWIHRTSIVVRHSTFLYRWQWHVAEQCT